MRISSSPKGITWIDLNEPTPAELATIIRDVKLSEPDARLCVEKNTRPGWFMNNHYVLFSLSVPIFFKKNRVTASASILFIITEEYLITIHHQPIPLLKRLAEEVPKNPDKFLPGQHNHPVDLFLKLISLLNDGTYQKIERLSKYITIVEAAVFQGNERKMVEEISFLTRDVMDLRKIFRPHRHLFNTLPSHAFFRADVYDAWLNIKHTMTDLTDALDVLYENIQQLSHTNATMLQHKENELLRIMAFYSSLAIPAWMLITAYNPSNDPNGVVTHIIYWTVLGALIAVLLFIFFRFRGKRVL